MANIARLALTGLIAGAFLFGSAGNASAATNRTQDYEPPCPANAVCFWRGYGYTGLRTVVFNGGSPTVCKAVAGGFARSVSNNTMVPRPLYARPGCSPLGYLGTVAPGEERPFLRPAALTWR